MENRPGSKILKIVGGVFIVLVATVLLLFLIEGLSSAVLFFLGNTHTDAKVAESTSEERAPVAERRHTEYDSELGWINVKNADIPDMYGEGVYLKTNSEAVRAERDYSESVESGRIRAVCSGDSFTYKYGAGRLRH
jgi:hypothetical protein